MGTYAGSRQVMNEAGAECAGPSGERPLWFICLWLEMSGGWLWVSRWPERVGGWVREGQEVG